MRLKKSIVVRTSRRYIYNIYALAFRAGKRMRAMAVSVRNSRKALKRSTDISGGKSFPETGVPIVSIIMPAFNAERYIRESIMSVLKQTERKWELLVIDDGSTDGTGGIVQSLQEYDKRIRLLSTQKNSGPAFARNVGIQNAKGEFIAFLDSDDMLSPKSLRKRIDILQKDRNAGGAYHRIVYVDQYGVPLGYTSGEKRHINFIDLSENLLHTINMMIRTPLLPRHGGFDESLKCGEDWDLWLRIARGGTYFLRADDCYAKYRMCTGSLTHCRAVEDFQQRLNVIQRAWGIDARCADPLPEFKDGLGSAMKSAVQTRRAFIAVLSEVVHGRGSEAEKLMPLVSMKVLCLMDPIDLAKLVKFNIVRNLCLPSVAWQKISKKYGKELTAQLEGLMTAENERFFNLLLREILS